VPTLIAQKWFMPSLKSLDEDVSVDVTAVEEGSHV